VLLLEKPVVALTLLVLGTQCVHVNQPGLLQ
jgi:hypothetical protein